MQRIQILPEDVARQIAAGEVVERPASVVKELMENALDAGARRITVRTRGAGSKLIEVTDDGKGILRDDLELALKSFATSKIRTAEDLTRIATYGFRGEALASISAVSRFRIVSCGDGSGAGFACEIEGRKRTAPTPAPHERGTTVRVEDLFFNTPARKKFLKSDTTERRRILEAVLSFALIDPKLEVHYSEDDRPVLDLVPAESWSKRIGAIMGASSMKHMVEVQEIRGNMRLEGMVSLPTLTRSNRNQQYLFVNRRLVKERTMIQAVQEAYRSVIPYRRFPVVVVSLEVPAEDVDVNVHPNKLEVRLEGPRRVFDIVRSGIKRALSGSAEERQAVGYGTVAADSQSVEDNVTPLHSHPSAHRVPTISGTTHADRVKDATFRYLAGVMSGAAEADINPQLSLRTVRDEEEPKTEEQIDRPDTDEALFWQLNNSYIFIQVRGGLVVIDQHAAHERIIFDTSRERLEKEIPVSQQILFPITLELSLPEFEAFKSSRDVFEKLGFHLEPFGGTSILVRGYPHGIKNWEEGYLLRQILDDINAERFPGSTHVDRVIASFACRSAVKAGRKLTVPEMKMLADQLFSVQNPYSCPHGRPTIQKISLEEIESWFQRR